MDNGSNRTITAFVGNEYEALLTELLSRGYTAVSITEIQQEQAHMFLRHDVDLCPERALQIARRESALAVRSTYYFLVSSSIYSITAAENRRILQEIIALGHEVGLHFDAEKYTFDSGDLDDFAAQECRILELCSGRPVQSISFHRPEPKYLNRKDVIAGRRHCYEPAFFSEIGYISDSNGGWYRGHPLDHPAIAERRAVQLLTHPIWWCNDTATSTVETIDRFFEHRREQLRAALAGTVTSYREAMQS